MAFFHCDLQQLDIAFLLQGDIGVGPSRVDGDGKQCGDRFIRPLIGLIVCFVSYTFVEPHLHEML